MMNPLGKTTPDAPVASQQAADGHSADEAAATDQHTDPQHYTQRVRNLNDAFRQTFIGGQVLITHGANELPAQDRFKLFNLIKSFDAFTEDNDPHGEHDFGSIKLHGQTYFWKIDCYDTLMLHHSPDATNPELTRRILTIMKAEEY